MSIFRKATLLLVVPLVLSGCSLLGSKPSERPAVQPIPVSVTEARQGRKEKP